MHLPRDHGISSFHITSDCILVDLLGRVEELAAVVVRSIQRLAGGVDEVIMVRELVLDHGTFRSIRTTLTEGVSCLLKHRQVLVMSTISSDFILTHHHDCVHLEIRLQLLRLKQMHQPSIFIHLFLNQLAELILNINNLFSIYLFALIWHLLRIVLNTCQFEKLHYMLILSRARSTHLVQGDHLFLICLLETTASKDRTTKRLNLGSIGTLRCILLNSIISFFIFSAISESI